MNDPGRFGGCLLWAMIALFAPLLFVSSVYGQDADRYLCEYQPAEGELHTDYPDFRPVFSDDETMVALVARRFVPQAGAIVDWRVIILDVPTCHLISDIYVSYRYHISSLAFSPNNKDIAVLVNDGRIRVFDAKTGEEDRDQRISYLSVTDKPSHPWYARHIQFSRDGTKIIFQAGSNPHDISIIIFPLSDWKNGWTEVRHNDSGAYTNFYNWTSSRVRSSPDRKYMVVEYSRSSIPGSNAPEGYTELHVYDVEAGGEFVCYTGKVYFENSIDWFQDAWKILALGKNKDYPDFEKELWVIDVQSSAGTRECHVEKMPGEWGSDPSGRDRNSLSGVRQLDAQHLLFHVKGGRTEVWDFSSNPVEEIKRHGNSISFSSRAVSKHGNFFAGISGATGAFALFYWNSTTRVSTQDGPTLTELQVYPNPTADYVRFTQDGRVALYDVLGRRVLDEQVNSQRHIAVDHLPDGLYLYRFITLTESYSGKLIKR